MKKRKTLTAKKELIKGRTREITLRELNEARRPGMTWVEAAEEGYKILGEPPLTPDEKKEFEQFGKAIEQFGKALEPFGQIFKESEKLAEAGKIIAEKCKEKENESKARYKKVLRGEKACLKNLGKSIPPEFKDFYFWFIIEENPDLYNMSMLGFLGAKITTIHNYHLHFYSDDREQVRAIKTKERYGKSTPQPPEAKPPKIQVMTGD